MGEWIQNAPPGDAAAAATTPRPDGSLGDEMPEDEEAIDIETALLALSEDMSGPTVDVDLGALSPVERGAVLRCLRERLGLPPQRPE